jgi:hypothetical protein
MFVFDIMGEIGERTMEMFFRFLLRFNLSAIGELADK